MTAVVETYWGPKVIDDATYWHLVSTEYLCLTIFYNNVRVGKGELPSVSAEIEAEPHTHNMQTPYSITHDDDEKEKFFEDIRSKRFQHCPSRLKALYVFDDYSLAQRALVEWYPNEKKIVYECRILPGSLTHKADTVWLNASRDQWVVNAMRYWEGAMTEMPFPEVIVHGAIYFPEWESFNDT
ncbi:MAG: hypothetical protein QG657_4055 [Acidobacteriota bacterium]|nr:hypothetical protein [Acidobacteriota bacterium]